MRVDINGYMGRVVITGLTEKPINITKEEAMSLAFLISSAIQDEEVTTEGDELWAEELTRQHKQDVEEELSSDRAEKALRW